DIKGHLRSRRELIEASGYAQRPRDFHDLLRILDTELRLVTPSDPDGEARGRRQPSDGAARQGADASGIPPAGECCYQLTHDYRGPAVGQWLTRRRQETWRGRAALRLAERAAQWAPTRQSRFLPWLPELLLFWLGVPRRRQKPQERALIQAAAK